jgi:hypothetical protein
MIFFIGVVGTLAWQSYGRGAREVIARWLAPRPVAQAAPAPFAGASSDDLLAMSRSLAALRDGVDKLAADITKLQATKQDTPDRAAHLPSAADVPVQKPVPPTAGDRARPALAFDNERAIQKPEALIMLIIPEDQIDFLALESVYDIFAIKGKPRNAGKKIGDHRLEKAALALGIGLSCNGV